MKAKATIRVCGAFRAGEGFHANLRPWTRWTVTAHSGVEFSTFDGAVADRAFNSVGQFAEVEYEIDGPRRTLLSLKPIKEEAA